MCPKLHVSLATQRQTRLKKNPDLKNILQWGEAGEPESYQAEVYNQKEESRRKGTSRG